MSLESADFVAWRNSQEANISESVEDALTSTIGILLLNYQYGQTANDSDEVAIYLQRGKQQGLYELQKHMARVYKGFLLQLHLDEFDTPRVNLKTLRHHLPEPKLKNIFEDFIEQLEAPNEVPQREDLSEEFTLYKIAFTRLVNARQIALTDINENAFSGLPFAKDTTFWGNPFHPETIWTHITDTYRLADKLKDGGVDLTPKVKQSLLQTTHFLAVEAEIVT